MTREKVEIVEVGGRDGLQNEKTIVSTADKLEFLRRLANCGLRRIEATACVSPRRVPQFADYPQVLTGLASLPKRQWAALAANKRGLDAALAAGVGEIALFTAASDAFAEKNIGCSFAESLRRFAPLAAAAKERGARVRGYLSTVVRCPYSGAVKPGKVAAAAAALARIGCDEISLGETLGVGTPATVRPMLAAVLAEIPAQKIAAHFHDTYGAGIANIAVALEAGVRIVDAAAGGLGGCPFAPGAGGNAASEDVLYFLTAEGFDTGIDAAQLAKTGKWICNKVGKEYRVKAGVAGLAKLSGVAL